MDSACRLVEPSLKREKSVPESYGQINSSQILAGHEKDGHNFFAVADEDEMGGFLVVSPEGMSDVGEREY